MELNKLPILNFVSNCPTCGLPTSFKMFEPNSPGGEFATYIGQNSGRFYRVDLGDIYYLKKDLKVILAPAIETEGGEGKLLEMPKKIKCLFCKKYFKAERLICEGEEFVEAIVL